MSVFKDFYEHNMEGLRLQYGIREALKQGVGHKGFSLYHIYTSCVTFDKVFKTWANLKKRIHPLPDDYDPGNFHQAFNQVLEHDFSTGIIYRAEEAARQPEQK